MVDLLPEDEKHSEDEDNNFELLTYLLEHR
jgi:hypothetical protein